MTTITRKFSELVMRVCSLTIEITFGKITTHAELV